MTGLMFTAARERGNAAKIGQLNPTGRYGVAEGVSILSLVSCCLVLPRENPWCACGQRDQTAEFPHSSPGTAYKR
jgi:hypothetical protein